jgi:TetR/AcrR family transcriptional repressor of nem operon
MKRAQVHLKRSQNDDRHRPSSRRSADKAETRRRILDAAASAFRQHGLDGIGIADIMRKAGLTHGGFYAHFASKEELIAAAMTHAERQRRGQGLSPAANDRSSMMAALDGYLTSWHREHPENGCFVAALGSELVRSGGRARDLVCESLNAWLRRYTRLGNEKQRRAATTAYAAMVGGIVLARSATDRHQADQILSDVRSFMRSVLQASASKSAHASTKGSQL